MQNSMQVFPRQPRQIPKIEIPGDDARRLKKLLSEREESLRIKKKLYPRYRHEHTVPEISLPNADLEECNFSCFDLREVNLKGADFRNANLSNSNLRGANLEGANLEGAGMQGVSLQDANLEGADFRNANLSYSNLYYSNMERANLQGANLERANLEDTKLFEGNLEGANLEGANLSNSNLSLINLNGANLTGANLSDSHLIGAKIDEETKFSLLTQLPYGNFATLNNLETFISNSRIGLFFKEDIEYKDYMKQLGEEDLNPENFGIQAKEFLKEATKNQLNRQFVDYADTKPEQITDDPEILSDYGRTLIKAAYLGSSLGRLSHHISSIARKLEDQENPNINSNTPYISQQNYIQLNRFTQQEGSTDISYGIMAGDLFNYQNCESVDSMTPPPHQNYTEGVLNEHISVWMLKDWEEKEFKKLSKYTPTEQTKILRTQFELIKAEYSDYLEKGDKSSPAFIKPPPTKVGGFLF